MTMITTSGCAAAGWTVWGGGAGIQTAETLEVGHWAMELDNDADTQMRHLWASSVGHALAEWWRRPAPR